ncbi:MAG TPA: HU family DNA-binding protein [Verrucomicrobiae bacterium]|nr:HU family DNA-binding protein [Verrucomicrobiae bacterium]
MTKAELVTAVADSAGLSKGEAEKAVKAFVDAITGCLKKGDKLSIVGFGTFMASERAARTGQNPQTGEKIEIAASLSPKFKAGKALKDAINEK